MKAMRARGSAVRRSGRVRSPSRLRSWARKWAGSSAWAFVAASISLAAAPPPAVADVVRDGSIGNAGPGSVATDIGPMGGIDYLIGESDGQRAGNNLYHSFDRFDLSASERAIYQGSASIRNLITRVTGGASSIDGAIVSEIAGANLFFINPAGVVFGENARLDVSGAFYVSTADRVLFEGGEQFDAALGSMPTLSIEDVAGFGFLDAPAPISIRGSQIELALDQSLGLIGGDLEILGDRSDGQSGLVSARSGRIDLASLASSGQVFIDADLDGDGQGDGLLDVRNVSLRGQITIAGDTTVSTSGIDRDPYRGALVQPGDGSGPVNVYAHDLLIENADIRTLTVTREDAGDVTIDLDGDFVARSIPGGKQSGIVAGTGLTIEPGPDDVVTTQIFPFHSNTFVTAQICGSVACGIRYEADGKAGDVRIRAENVILEDGGRLTARSDSQGDAGTIEFEVRDTIRMAGIEETGERSGLSSTAEGTGNPGVIRILSPNARLVMRDQAAIVIQNSAASLASGSTPGSIEIDVASVDMRGDSRIDSSTRGAGPGGNLLIRARDAVRLHGRSDASEFTGITTLSQPGSTGTAGTIRIEAARLELDAGAEISARPAGADALGDAGSLEFEVSDRIQLRHSKLLTDSQNAAGGNITAFFGKVLSLEDSEISASVTAGAEPGGNVTLRSNPGSAVVLDGSRVIAQADQGAGGNILLATSLLLQDPTSQISASSNAGIDGTVVIRAPDGQLIELSQDLTPPSLDTSELLDEPCAARRPDGANSLVVARQEGMPLGVEAVLPAFLPASVYAQLAARDTSRPDAFSAGSGSDDARREEQWILAAAETRIAGGSGACGD